MRGAISLALVGTLADTHIVDVLRRFARRSKDVRLELRTASSAEVTNLVRRGEATLGLRYFASDRPELVSQPAGGEAMLVVAAPGHRLAGRRVRQRTCWPANAGSAFRRRPTNAIPPVMCWRAS